jgi:integrase
MPEMSFTEDAVAKLAKPAKGQLDWYDPGKPNLILRASYGGKKTWRVLFYRNQMPIRLAIGRWPNMKLKEAWEIARKYDPDAPRKRDGETFRAVADSFVARYVEKGDTGKDGKRREPLRTKDEIVRCLDKYVRPVWDSRLFRSIKRSEVADLLDHIEDKHGARQADYVLAVLRKLMRWYATRSDDYIPVIVPGMSRSNPEDAKRDRLLSDDEIRLVWEHADGIFGALLKVALLTAQRRDKVSTMRHRDIVDGVWTIPAEPREKNVPGSLKLPPMVFDIIGRQSEITGNPYVFPGSRQGQRRGERSGPSAFNSFSERKAALDEKLAAACKKAKRKPMARWTIHDLRRTARTLMSRAKVPSEHAERVLGHVIKGVEGVYDRFAYFDEKADALAKLANQIDVILNPTPAGNNVITIKTAG